MVNSLAQDLDHVLAHTGGLWEELRGQRIFITGGTGFFGCWLLESFAWANEKLQLDAHAVVLTRNRDAFAKKAAHLAADKSISFHTGDVRDFAFPSGSFTHIIHAATDSSTNLNQADPLLMLDTIVKGTRHTLDFTVACGAKKFLLTSSGAVYGKQPAEMTRVPEDYTGAPNPLDPASAYGEGKRIAELLCALYHRQYSIEPKIARCFAFVGPYLPLNAHFAIGNFIRDALAGGPVRVNGDGTPYRSYLYAADLAIWLWTILLRGGACCPYNVGSENALTISALANIVAGIAGLPVSLTQQAKPELPPMHYVPNTTRAREKLGLYEMIEMPESIRRTGAWHSTDATSGWVT